jgi:L-amino acid N-acyltransferase YncA
MDNVEEDATAAGLFAYRIEPMQPTDWPQVRVIYEQGIATGNATFETAAPGWPAWNAAHHPFGRLVARADVGILGWAALSPVSARQVYAGVAEVSLYVAAAARGQGIGHELLAELVKVSEESGIWTLQAGILVENEASQRTHAGCGFCVVGCRERIGQLRGVWRDVMLMERRSPVLLERKRLVLCGCHRARRHGRRAHRHLEVVQLHELR